MDASSSSARQSAAPRWLRNGEAEAALFDLDGTLVEPGIDFSAMERSVLALAAAYGCAPAGDARIPALEAIAAARDTLEVTSPERARAFEVEAAAVLEEIEVEAARRVRPYPNVPEMLDALARSGMRVGIVTRNSRVAVEALLARHPLHHDALLTRDDVSHAKPDPRHLLAVLALLGARPARALMVGDHAMDIAAGRAIGAFTVGVGSAGAFAAAPPDLLLDGAARLGDWLSGRCEDVGVGSESSVETPHG